MSIEKSNGERGLWRYNKETKSLDKIEQAPKIVTHAVHTDEIPPTMSMTGSDRWFTSKSALRRHYREEGYREVGEILPAPKPKTKEERRAEIRETVMKVENDLKYGMAPISEKERERSLREEREWTKYKQRQS